MARLLRWVLPVVLLGLLARAASAQTWRDAVKKGDYQAAAMLLQPLAVNSLLLANSGDPAALEQLALMYSRGLGVPPDPVLACGLAQAFSSAVERQPPAVSTLDAFNVWQAHLREVQELANNECTALSAFDRESADRIACFTFGMPDEVIALGSQMIRVDRAGIRLASDQSRRSDIPVNCPQLIARVRPLAVDVPADAVHGVEPRHFIEVLAWLAAPNGQDPSTLRYVLFWQLFELRTRKLELAVLEHVGDSDAWPSPALPPDFDKRVTVEMIRTGHVHWKIDGVPPKRGWVMLPEKHQ